MPALAALPLIAAPFIAETVGATLISTIAADAVISSTLATAVGTGALSGLSTAMRGGNIQDVLRSAVLSGSAAGVGAYVGNVVGAEVAGATGYKIAGSIAANIAKASTSAVILGQDVGKSLFTGLAAGVPLALGQMDSFTSLPEPVQRSIAGGISTAITGGDVKSAMLTSALSSANVMGGIINSSPELKDFFSDPKNESAGILIQNALASTVSASLQGKDVSTALERSLVTSAGQVLGKFGAQQFSESLAEARSKYDEAQKAENAYQEALKPAQDAYTTGTTYMTKYKNMIDSYVDPYNEKLDAFNAAKSDWQAAVDAGDVERANSLVGDLNAKAADVNKLAGKIKAATDNYNFWSGKRDDTTQAALVGTEDEKLAYEQASAAALQSAKQVDQYSSSLYEDLAKAFAGVGQNDSAPPVETVDTTPPVDTAQAAPADDVVESAPAQDVAAVVPDASDVPTPEVVQDAEAVPVDTPEVQIAEGIPPIEAASSEPTQVAETPEAAPVEEAPVDLVQAEQELQNQVVPDMGSDVVAGDTQYVKPTPVFAGTGVQPAPIATTVAPTPNLASSAPLSLGQKDATIAPTASPTQQAASASATQPGTWLGGLGRGARFIDPLEASQAGSPEVITMNPPSPLQSLYSQSNDMWTQQPQASYYSYGVEPNFNTLVNAMGSAGYQPQAFKNGGNVMASPLMAASGGDVEHKGSHYVQGAGGGQDDLIDAKLADGEYVFDAEIVSALGDGSNKRGAEILDKWREQIRKHKRSASIKGIPPKAKSPLAYMREIK